MTVIENYSPKVQYQGPVAIDDLLSISFPYNDTEDVKCLLNQTELVFNRDYTVTGQGLIFKITATEEDTITIYRSTPLDQQAEFPQNNRFNSAKLNASLDKICMQQQEQNEKITRSVKVPIDTNVSFEGSLPTPIPNRILRINEEASGFEFVPYDLDERLDTFEDTVVDNITAGQEAIENSFEEFKDETNIAIDNIDTKVINAIDTANTANTKSDEAIDIANTASAAATNAVNTSNSAVTSANTAVATANNANIKSDEALLTSQEAKEASLIAEENATTAKEKVDIFEQDIETVLEAADQIAQLEDTVDTAVQASEAATIAAEDATQAAEDAIASLDSKLDIDGTAVKATADADGNVITETYRTIADSYNKDDVNTKFDAKVNVDDMVAVDFVEAPFISHDNITNCILEIPQRLKLELNASKALVLKAGSQIIVPNGFEADGTTKKFDYITVGTDIQQGNGHAAQDLYFVRNYSSPKYLIGYHATKCFSGNTAPTGFGTYAFWYDTSNNLVKWTQNSGATWTSGYSLPVGLTTGSSATVISSIDQIFNGMGFIGNTLFALPGIKCLAPNGRNADGTLKNIKFTTNKVLVDSEPDTNSRPIKIFLYSDMIESWGSDIQNVMFYRTRPSVAPKNYCTAYIEDENKWIRSLNSTTWTRELNCIDAGDYILTNNIVTSFQPKNSFQAVDYNEIAGIKAYIKDTYINGTSWYRVWSDGWIEQGGISNAGTITFLKSFSNTNYTLVKTGKCEGTNGDWYGGANYNAGYYSKSVNKFVCYSNGQVTNYNWYACGY